MQLLLYYYYKIFIYYKWYILYLLYFPVFPFICGNRCLCWIVWLKHYKCSVQEHDESISSYKSQNILVQKYGKK